MAIVKTDSTHYDDIVDELNILLDEDIESEPSKIADRIKNITTLKKGTADATATENEIFLGQIAYSNGNPIMGSFTIKEELDMQNSTIKDINKNLTNKIGEPKAKVEQEKIVSAINNGQQIITPDPGKVLSKVTVNTNVPGGAFNPTDATATQNQIFAGETAYINSGKVSGTFTIEKEIQDTKTKIASLETALEEKSAGGNADTSDATATSEDILTGTTAYIAAGKTTGTLDLSPELTEQDSTIAALEVALKTKAIKSEEIIERTYTMNGTYEITPTGNDKTISNAKIIVNVAGASDIDWITGKGITSITSELVEFRSGSLFGGLPDLVEFFGPNILTTGSSFLSYCPNLVKISLPKMTAIGNETFYRNYKATNYNLPSLTAIQYRTFYHNDSLTKLDLPLVANIASTQAFYKCDLLETLILRSSTICLLADINNFDRTKIATKTGYIYVPKALIEDYKVAPNWSTFATQFRAIEDYPDETKVEGI